MGRIKADANNSSAEKEGLKDLTEAQNKMETIKSRIRICEQTNDFSPIGLLMEENAKA